MPPAGGTPDRGIGDLVPCGDCARPDRSWAAGQERRHSPDDIALCRLSTQREPRSTEPAQNWTLWPPCGQHGIVAGTCDRRCTCRAACGDHAANVSARGDVPLPKCPLYRMPRIARTSCFTGRCGRCSKAFTWMSGPTTLFAIPSPRRFMSAAGGE
jgi:hypothetical protein